MHYPVHESVSSHLVDCHYRVGLIHPVLYTRTFGSLVERVEPPNDFVALAARRCAEKECADVRAESSAGDPVLKIKVLQLSIEKSYQLHTWERSLDRWKERSEL
jgi:hypothetical protein